MEQASSDLASGLAEPQACILMLAECILEATDNRRQRNHSRN